VRRARPRPVVGVDLACARWRDVGIAILTPGVRGGHVAVEAFTADALGLEGSPTPLALAAALDRLGRERDARHLLVDGPGAWKRNGAHDRLARLSERLARTPGKAGLPGVTWPRGFLRFTEFSYGLYDALASHGWSRLVEPAALDDRDARFALETFPTATWRALGLTPLAGKARATPAHVRAAARALARVLPLDLPRGLGHDALQAVVSAVPGLAIGAGRRAEWVALGETARIEDGTWREGWVVLPATHGVAAARRTR
jgi:hypothetical protein